MEVTGLPHRHTRIAELMPGDLLVCAITDAASTSIGGVFFTRNDAGTTRGHLWISASLANCAASKNGNRNETVCHGRSGHRRCCPLRVTIKRLLYHRQRGTPSTAPLASYYQNGRLTPVRAADITHVLRHTAGILHSNTGIHRDDISARSLRAGGAMALLCGKVDANTIKLLGRPLAPRRHCNERATARQGEAATLRCTWTFLQCVRTTSRSV